MRRSQAVSASPRSVLPMSPERHCTQLAQAETLWMSHNLPSTGRRHRSLGETHWPRRRPPESEPQRGASTSRSIPGLSRRLGSMGTMLACAVGDWRWALGIWTVGGRLGKRACSACSRCAFESTSSTRQTSHGSPSFSSSSIVRSTPIKQGWRSAM